MGHAFKNGDKVQVLRTDVPYMRFVGYHPTVVSKCIVAHDCEECEGNLIIVPIGDVKAYKEPVKVSGWINVYKASCITGGTRSFHETKAEALAAPQWTDRIATIYVSGTEGEEP